MKGGQTVHPDLPVPAASSSDGSKERSSSSTESGAKRTRMTGASSSFMEYDDEYSAAIKLRQSDADAEKARDELVKAKDTVASLSKEVEKCNAKAVSMGKEVEKYKAEAESANSKVVTLGQYKAKADAADARQGSHSRELSKSKAETARVEAELTGLKQEMETLKAGQVVVSGGGAGDDVALMREFERLQAFEREYNGGHEGLIFANVGLREEVIVFCLTIALVCDDLT